MKSPVLVGLLAFAFSACGNKEEPLKVEGGESQNPTAPSAIEKSKRPAFQRPEPRAFDPSRATPEELAARLRLDERLEKAAIAKEKRDAERALEREKRIAQMTEQMTTRLREADANADGFLAKEEVTGPFERRFDESDTNGDGQLDGAEQQAMMASLRERMEESSGRGVGRRDSGGGGRDRGGRRGDRN